MAQTPYYATVSVGLDPKYFHARAPAGPGSEMQSGRYYHNIKNDAPTPYWSVTSGAIGHVDLTKAWPWALRFACERHHTHKLQSGWHRHTEVHSRIQPQWHNCFESRQCNTVKCGLSLHVALTWERDSDGREVLPGFEKPFSCLGLDPRSHFTRDCLESYSAYFVARYEGLRSRHRWPRGGGGAVCDGHLSVSRTRRLATVQML